jgi:hypothetical protein
MSLSDLFHKPRPADENATVIFDGGEPIGQPTDLVLPYRPWFARFRARRNTAVGSSVPEVKQQ